MENLENEVWEDIEEFKGVYQVSNLGRVKSLDKYVKNRSGIDSTKIVGKILSQKTSKFGYKSAGLCVKQKVSWRLIHRLVAIAFLPNPLNLSDVNHVDGIKSNNFVENLEWLSKGDNQRHAYKLGLKNQDGTKNPKAKLNDEQVLEIRRTYKEGNLSQRKIGEIYNVSRALIGYIVRNQIWNNINIK